MGKRNKPVLSLAAAMQRVTPTTMLARPPPAATAAASSSSAAAAASPAAAAVPVVGLNRKRKRAALISSFHVLMREQDALATAKPSLSPSLYLARSSDLNSKLDALGGLQSYQSLSIAGHSNIKYHAFNTSHWIIDVLAGYADFANLQQYVGRHPPSGGSEASVIAAATAAAGGVAGSMSVADEKRLAKRQKERERKRAKKKARKAAAAAEEEEVAAAAASAASSASKGSSKHKHAASARKQQPIEEEAESDGDAAPEQDQSHNASVDSDGEEHEEEDQEGDASGSSSATAAVPSSPPLFSSTHRIRLLDVGALTNHYLPYASQIDCEAIDLSPQHPSVRACDFFDLNSSDPEYNRSFDVVVLSLVLNFVGDRFKRGLMIQSSVRMLRGDGRGRLFIILPSACLLNSRWMNHDTFVERCMLPLGLKLMKWKYTNKLAMYEFRRVEVDLEEEEERREAAEKAAEEEEAAATAAAEQQMQDADAPDSLEDDPSDPDGSKKFARAAAAAAAAAAAKQSGSKKKKRKGFQPAGIVLQGETRNNFSIAWRAE